MKAIEHFVLALAILFAFSLQGCHKDEVSENVGQDEEEDVYSDSLNITVNGLSFNMKYVAGGTFIMGGQNYNLYSPSYDPNAQEWEMPLHYVEMSSFYIAETEVTQALWKSVMGDCPSHFVGDDLPVDSVNWYDCHRFIDSLNFMTGHYFFLPTEAQWEYAARGGNLSHDYKYSGSNTISQVAWYAPNSISTHPVATKHPNELGLYDMSGNVMEWCRDYFGEYSDEPQKNPTGPETGTRRVIRGGSWGNASDVSRVSCRNSCREEVANDNLGLRLVCYN